MIDGFKQEIYDSTEPISSRFITVFSLYLLISTPLLVWYSLSPFSVWIRGVGTAVITTMSVVASYKLRGSLFGGLARVVLGKPEIKLTKEGFQVTQKGIVFKFRWERVQEVEIIHHEENGEVIRRLLAFCFDGGRIFSIEDDPGWKKLIAIKMWSGAALDGVSFKSGLYDETLFRILPGVELLEEQTL